MGELSRYFRTGLEKHKLNYSELARKAGISSVYVMKVMKGERIPSDTVIGKLARTLELETRKALFLAHKDKAPEEFRDLFRLPEARFPIIREKLFDLYDGPDEEVRGVIEADRLGPVERSIVGLCARLLAARAIVEPEFRDHHSMADDFLEKLEWSEAYFRHLEEELRSPARQKLFCQALEELVTHWNYSVFDDTVTITTTDGRRSEYKFCLLETGKFRRELVLNSVKSRAGGKDKLKIIQDGHVLSRGTPSRAGGEVVAITLEELLLDRMQDDVTRDFFMKALELSPGDLEETREIVSLKLRRHTRKSASKE